MSMNWDDILKEQESDPGFAPVPDGKYPIRVEKAEAVKASTGADMLKVQMVVEGGPYDTKKIFTNIVFSRDNPTAMRFTLRKLAALGVTREALAAQNPTTAQIATMITGATAEAEVTIREYEGEKSNDVKTLRRIGAATASAPAPAAASGVPAAPSVPAPPSIPTPAAEEAAPPIPTPPPEPTPEPTPPAPEPEAAPGEPPADDEEPF